ncbi:hypothetical protein GCM10007079_09830 [Nocardiopsis terrae]|uniref:Uncharacterized protein n=1 Tax=Nocardiopsis terrae TaxID=372655 RepID=A0ABR9HCP2_9ACTN|nr:hypothetical protein [Nocardiopsis terrae]MBE1456802.1 hypothetical protein [Nocardiopsis terrae]GHC75049.1 hypothetical protein GCM10007079_09830 [Nocardiopsis terrae]
MKLYADTPVRACLQLVCDLAALVWAFVWIHAALALRETLLSLNRPGELMSSTGAGLTEHMDTAAENVRQVPLAGEALAAPFTGLSGTGESLSAAGDSFQDSVGTLALTLPLLVAALPLFLLAATWLPARARWIVRATGTVRLRALAPEARTRLLALRALSGAPAAGLAAVHEDPAGAWQENDRTVVAELAALELRRLGLRPKARNGRPVFTRRG